MCLCVFCGRAVVAPTECTWENTTWRTTTRLVPWLSAPPRSLSMRTGTLTESGRLRLLPSSVRLDYILLFLPFCCKCCSHAHQHSVSKRIICIHAPVTILPWSSWQLPSPSLIPSWLPVCPPLVTSCLTMLPATWLAGAVSGVSYTNLRHKDTKDNNVLSYP